MASPRIRAVISHIVAAMRGRDLALWAAGLTFFAALAVVPMLLLALRGAAVVFGGDIVADGARELGAALPSAHDASPALDALARAALTASWPVLLLGLLPASLYGEGLRRSFKQVAGSPSTGLTGWAGRIGFVPVLILSPLLIALPLAITPVVAPLYQDGGWAAALGVVLSFHIDWIPLSVAIGIVFALCGPTGLPVWKALVAGFAVGAVLTGFLHGFVLFLAIPLDWSVPFAGLSTVGVVVALALWLFLLHVMLLVGYRVALSAHHVHTDGAPAPPRNEEGDPDVAVRPRPRSLAGRRAGDAVGPTTVDEAGTDLSGRATGRH